MDLVPFAIPFFLLSILFEIHIDRKRGTAYYRSNDAINSLSMGIISTTSKLLVFDISLRVFSWVEHNAAISTLPADKLWVWVFCFILYDFCYYWFHRISHERKFFWAAHVSHHQSEEYNLTTALRQTSMGFIASWVFYIPCFVIGIPAYVFFTVASVNLIYQFWVHTRFIPKLGWYEWIFVSPSNHRIHHARNPRYIDKNYGGVFILWDRLFGTYQEECEDIPAEYGILKALNNWNPLWANIHIFVEMLRHTLQTSNWRDKCKIWWGRTDYLPADIKASPTILGTKFNPKLNRWLGFYTVVQFVMALLLGIAILAYSEITGTDHVTAPALAIMACLACIGMLMENRGELWEVSRLLAMLLWASTLEGWWSLLLVNYTLASTALFLFACYQRQKAGSQLQGSPIMLPDEQAAQGS